MKLTQIENVNNFQEEKPSNGHPTGMTKVNKTYEYQTFDIDLVIFKYAEFFIVCIVILNIMFSFFGLLPKPHSPAGFYSHTAF